MRALALDIGAGTVDMLLFEDGRPIENSVKMVLPSPSLFYAERVREATRKKLDLHIGGFTIGGGALSSAIRAHIVKGYKVSMTSSAAYSLRNNIEEVENIGVEISDYPEGDVGTLFLDEVKLQEFEEFLNRFGETIEDVDLVAVSVKDHGAPPSPDISNREFRINKFKELLRRGSNPQSLLFKEGEIPEFFIRMNSSVEASKSFLPSADVFVMDTSFSSVFGCLEDKRVNNSDTVLAVNLGNGHTVAAVLEGKRILGFFEHHTGRLTLEKLDGLIEKLAEGSLTHEEVFEDGGHGAVLMTEMPGLNRLDHILSTGPRRSLLEGSRLEVIQASPGGDVMMTGTIGILSATVNRLTL